MAAKPPKVAKPTRKPKEPATVVAGVDDPRFARISDRLDRIEARLDKMADALAPALYAWRNIRARIPGWILSLGDPPPPAQQPPQRPPFRRGARDEMPDDGEE